MTLDAIIFDFDGVLVDSEPIHLQCFREVLADVGVELTREAYYARYLGFDDRECFITALADNHKRVDDATLSQMIVRKSSLVRERFAGELAPIPGAVELARLAGAAGIKLAICSGALREDIHAGLAKIGIGELFGVVVSADDVARSKPDPACYRLVVSQLSGGIDPSRAVVIEDSPAGIEAARGAGLKVLALTTSYGSAELSAADAIADDLRGMTLERLARMSLARSNDQ